MSSVLSALWDWVAWPWKSFQWYIGKRKVNVLFLGLDNAGKTTLLHLMRNGTIVAAEPTTFPTNEPFTVGSVTFNACDVGGHDAVRRMWKSYLHGIDGIVFVVDASDQARMAEASLELQTLMEDETLRANQVPFLVLANKTDKPDAIKVEMAMYAELGNISVSNNWNLFMCSVVHKRGVQEGFTWFGAQLAARK